jgi:hypothetical protein
MADPFVDRMFGGAVSGMEDEELLFSRISQRDARELLWQDINTGREQEGLPPLDEPDYPGPPTTGGTIFKNIGSLFGGQKQTGTPFSTSYSPDIIVQTLMEKGMYTREEAEEYRDKLPLDRLLGLLHRYPRTHAADERTRLSDPVMAEEARRSILGIVEPG